MSNVIKYKEFQNLQDFEEYLCCGNDNYIYDGKFCWDVSRTIRHINNFNGYNSIFEPSDIKFYINVSITYFYIENNIIYCVRLVENKSWFKFETKLYHLIHGPKALPIPDAFKVLAL